MPSQSPEIAPRPANRAIRPVGPIPMAFIPAPATTATPQPAASRPGDGEHVVAQEELVGEVGASRAWRPALVLGVSARPCASPRWLRAGTRARRPAPAAARWASRVRVGDRPLEADRLVQAPTADRPEDGAVGPDGARSVFEFPTCRRLTPGSSSCSSLMRSRSSEQIQRGHIDERHRRGACRRSSPAASRDPRRPYGGGRSPRSLPSARRSTAATAAARWSGCSRGLPVSSDIDRDDLVAEPGQGGDDPRIVLAGAERVQNQGRG